jgi:hypothetical protein
VSAATVNGDRAAWNRERSQVRFVAAPVPRTALTRAEAAESMGMSVDSFERYVQPHVRMVRRGKLRVIPVPELERWLRDNAELVLEGAR